MATKKMATKKTAKKKVAKNVTRRATQDKKGPKTSQHSDECTGIALTVAGPQLRLVADSNDEFTVKITVQGQSCRSLLQMCWDGQQWVNC